MSDPRIAVVIPTSDRAALLAGCLASLERQTLPVSEYEIVVVDDGSEDETPAVCSSWQYRLPLRLFRQARSGASAARNLGLFGSVAPLTLFFDDDEVAAPDLLAEHLAAHAEFSAERAAVLGYTTWAPELRVTPLMHYVTEIGQFLLSYPSIPVGRPLDFSYFWTGRISCKRSFLTHFGIFSPSMSRLEDIELGFRLWRQGMEVRYWPRAVNYRATPVDFPGFCRRCEVDGGAIRRLAELHDDPAMQSYCGLEGAEERWRGVADDLPKWIAAAAALERAVRNPFESEDATVLAALWELYRRCFTALRWKGLANPARASTPAHERAAYNVGRR